MTQSRYFWLAGAVIAMILREYNLMAESTILLKLVGIWMTIEVCFEIIKNTAKSNLTQVRKNTMRIATTLIMLALLLTITLL